MADVVILDRIPEEAALQLYLDRQLDEWDGKGSDTCFYMSIDPVNDFVSCRCFKFEGRYFVGVSPVKNKFEKEFFAIYGYKTFAEEMFMYTSEILTMATEGFQVETNWNGGCTFRFHRSCEIQQW